MDALSSIGSANLDNRSLHLNDEANFNVLDTHFAAEQTRLFERDRARSIAFTLENYRDRALTEVHARNCADSVREPALSFYRLVRVVLKFGSGILANARGNTLDQQQFQRLCSEVAASRQARPSMSHRFEWARGAGLGVLALKDRPEDLAARQACAAVGQSKLMQLYATMFEKHRLHVAQLLPPMRPRQQDPARECAQHARAAFERKTRGADHQ
jgi:hypothetical protein